jgi:hypothetical protein
MRQIVQEGLIAVPAVLCDAYRLPSRSSSPRPADELPGLVSSLLNPIQTGRSERDPPGQHVGPVLRAAA